MLELQYKHNLIKIISPTKTLQNQMNDNIFIPPSHTVQSPHYTLQVND